jgi:hypothetical protein
MKTINKSVISSSWLKRHSFELGSLVNCKETILRGQGIKMHSHYARLTSLTIALTTGLPNPDYPS